MKILIADDDLMSRRLLEKILERRVLGGRHELRGSLELRAWPHQFFDDL